MMIEIYYQTDRQIKAEMFCNNGKTYLLHWFRYNDKQVLKQKYLEIKNVMYNKHVAKLTEEEYYLANLGNDNPKSYKEYLKE